MGRLLGDDHESCRDQRKPQDGQWDQAMALWKSIYGVNDFIWHNPFNPGVKALGNLLGHDMGECRRPVQPLSHDEMDALKAAITDLA